MQTEKIEQILNYTFKNKELLKTALTHLSYANENNVKSYETLEFFGDTLVNSIVTLFLYNNYDEEVGKLSKHRAQIVSTGNLCLATNNLGLNNYILTGKSLKSITVNILADIFESITAAVYLDGGINSAVKFVNEKLIKSKQHIDEIISKNIDYKTELQEFLQAKPKKPEINYLVKQSKKINNKTEFKVELYIDNALMASAQDFSIKKCEQKCSEIALNKLNVNNQNA